MGPQKCKHCKLEYLATNEWTRCCSEVCRSKRSNDSDAKNTERKIKQKKYKATALEKRTPGEVWADKVLTENGLFYSREHIFRFSRFDFYFKRKRIALEIDGEYHDDDIQKKKDLLRDSIHLKNHSVITYRVKNFDMDRLLFVISEIRKSSDFPKGKMNKRVRNSIIRKIRIERALLNH